MMEETIILKPGESMHDYKGTKKEVTLEENAEVKKKVN